LNIVWLPLADLTFDAQVDRIGQDSPQAAREVGDRVYEQVEQLAQFPELGRAGRGRGTRELVISRTPFVVVYRVRPKLGRVEILRVLHARQKWPPTGEGGVARTATNTQTQRRTRV